MIRARSLSELLGDYDAFLVDQFGVLLDGAGVYDHARGVLEALTAHGKRVLLISNSAKRSPANVMRLSEHGVARDAYIDVLSSGEVAHVELVRRIGASLRVGAPVWVESSGKKLQPLLGLNLTAAQSPGAAELVWIAGCQPQKYSLDEYAARLSGAARRGVPAICSNPDLEMLEPGGKTFGPGAVAKVYEGLGGAVEYFGKPHPAIYNEALRRLAPIDRPRVLAVGDSPAHDILGGARAGLATALVRTGVHAGESEAELLARCDLVGVMPDVILPRFAF